MHIYVCREGGREREKARGDRQEAEKDGREEEERECAHVRTGELKFNANLFWVLLTTLCFILCNNNVQIRMGVCILIISDSEWCRVRLGDRWEYIAFFRCAGPTRRLRTITVRRSQVRKDLASSPRTPFSVVNSGEYLANLGHSFISRRVYDVKRLS